MITPLFTSTRKRLGGTGTICRWGKKWAGLAPYTGKKVVEADTRTGATKLLDKWIQENKGQENSIT